jgi:3-isopropylmalate/(R)-2-methylmalate dehydratase small subunit
LPILECSEAVDGISAGDRLEVDFSSGIVNNLTTGKSFQSQPFPDFLQKLIASDGLVNYIKEK